MEIDRYEVLSGIARIVGDSAVDPARSIKEILNLLCSVLSLDDLVFLLFDSHRKIFSQTISSSGPDLLLPCIRKAAGTPEGAALKQRRPEIQEGKLHLSIGNSRRNYGVLTLNPAPAAPLTEELQSLLRAACDQLACLAQFALISGKEHRRMQQLTLLSELGEELNQAATLKAVLHAAIGAIRRHSRPSCIILRPLHGGTVMGRSQVRIEPAMRQLRPFFLALEEEQSARALSGRGPLFRHGLSRETRALLPSMMVVVPLYFQDRAMGTLTLFGDASEDVLPLSPTGEAKHLFSAIGSQIGHALERVTALERLEDLSAENERKLRETTLLFHIARVMHSTPRLNELMHLILSAATIPGGGGFERAMLFMTNERSGTLQGMLCVTRQTAPIVFPAQGGTLAWERPVVSEEAQNEQKQHPCCRQVMQQRLSFEENSALARAARNRRVVFVPRPDSEPRAAAALAQTLKLAPYACAPLFGRDRSLGVLVVDNPRSREEIDPERLRFLELFANLAGTAMENSMLLHRLEAAHQDLRETQERLIQGEKMAVLGEMATSVTHELRNPLVSIGGFARRLVRASTGGRSQEYAAIIAREVQRMEDMLSNILAFAKKEMLCFGECRVERAIEEAVALEIDTLAQRSVQLVTEISDSLPTIQGDEQKLRQVLINLISNARQAMSKGGVLTVRAYPAKLRGDTAVFVEVEDTGGGIPPDVLRNIFNPFFTTKEKGTGLGLSISHRIIEQHRGEIVVKNREKGALFILRLPVRAGDAPFR